MGAKFYRGADKPKKIRKRFSQTRSWFRTLKWTACTFLILGHRYPTNLLITQIFDHSLFQYRSRSSHYGCRTSFQGSMGILNRPTLSP